MTSLVNKSGDWTPNYHKILIFSPPKSLKSLRAARIDELADSNEPAIMGLSWSESDIASRRVHREPTLVFILDKNKDQRKRSLSLSLSIKEP